VYSRHDINIKVSKHAKGFMICPHEDIFICNTYLLSTEHM